MCAGSAAVPGSASSWQHLLFPPSPPPAQPGLPKQSRLPHKVKPTATPGSVFVFLPRFMCQSQDKKFPFTKYWLRLWRRRVWRWWARWLRRVNAALEQPVRQLAPLPLSSCRSALFTNQMGTLRGWQRREPSLPLRPAALSSLLPNTSLLLVPFVAF